jgi:hypothetical protein
LTIARAADAPSCDTLVASARARFRQPLDAVLRTLTVIALHEDGRVVRETDVGLGV